MIDQASVFAERFKGNPQVLQATVLGQGNIPGLDPYTALNALKLIKESQRMEMAGRAQQPTSSPSIVAEALAPAPSPQGLGAMVPNTMGQMPPGTPQGLAAMAPQQRAPVMQRSGGLAGMYTPEEDFAEGGIVAFQSGGLNSGEGMEATAVADDPLSRLIAEAEGTGAPSSTALNRAEEALNKYMNFVPKEMSEKEQEAFLDRYMARVKKAGGEDIYAPEIARGAQDEADRAKARRVGEAGAYFTAAGKILKGRNLAEGASEALPAFGSAMNEVEKLDQAAKTANARAQFLLKDAQRKERMGDARGAQAALAEARKFQQDANRAEGDKLRFSADIAARTVQYSRPAKAAGSGDASTKLPQVDRDAAAIAKQIVDLESSNPEDPKLPALKKKLEALEKIIATTKTTESGPGKLGAQETQIFVGAAKEATSSARKRGNQDAAYLAALRNRDAAAANNRMKEIYAEEIQKFFPSTPLSDLLAAAPPGDLTPTSGGAPAASKPAASAARVMSMADVQATAAASGKTTQEVIDAAKAKGYTIK
jgi:hypothetical protein